jgi:hypothetical protein
MAPDYQILITATIQGTDGSIYATAQRTDVADESEQEFFERLESEALRIKKECTIRWSRRSDGQVGYWSPGGCQIEPYTHNPDDDSNN